MPVRQVEAHVLDETDLDLYGHRVEVQFVERIRGMIAFDGVDELVRKMADDVGRMLADRRRTAVRVGLGMF